MEKIFNKTAIRVSSFFPGEKGKRIDDYFDKRGWQLQEWSDGENPAGYQVYFGAGVSVDNSFEYGFPYLFDQKETTVFFDAWDHEETRIKKPDYRTVKVISFRHDFSGETNFCVEPCPSTQEKIKELIRKVQRGWNYDENNDSEFFSWEIHEISVDVESLPSASNEVIKDLLQAEKEHLQYADILVSQEETIFMEHFFGLTTREIKDIYGMEPASSLLYEVVFPNGSIGEMIILVPDDPEDTPDIYLSVSERWRENLVVGHSDQEYFIATHEVADECLWGDEQWIYEFVVKIDPSMEKANNAVVEQMILATKNKEEQI